jgi:hypothetical protein
VRREAVKAERKVSRVWKRWEDEALIVGRVSSALGSLSGAPEWKQCFPLEQSSGSEFPNRSGECLGSPTTGYQIWEWSLESSVGRWHNWNIETVEEGESNKVGSALIVGSGLR